MSDVEAIDGTAEDASTELVPAPAPPALAVTPTVQAAELVERLAVIREAQTEAMVQDVDYGVIPGTDKPTLLKPGAEKLSVLFQLDVQLSNEKVWGPEAHLTVISHATVYHAPTGSRLGYGEGICTTREKKYGKRTRDRSCPQCEANAIKRSKYPPRENPNAEPGWYCFGKIGGCGANFAADDQRITGQETGEVDNPDLPDLWNTVVKMAEKRARVDAVLAVTGASALFTQDVEDMTPAVGASAPAARETRSGTTPASDSQKGRIRKDFKRLGLTTGQARAVLTRAGVGGDDPHAAVDGLAKHQASAVIDVLAQALPDPEHPALDNDASDFAHPHAGAFGDPDLPEDDPERDVPVGEPLTLGDEAAA